MRARKPKLMRKRSIEKGEAPTLLPDLKRVLVLQSITMVMLLLVIAIWLVVRVGDATQSVTVWPSLGATIYGAILALTGTILSARSVMRGFGQGGDQTGGSAMVSIYAGLLNKLVIVGGGIAFGLIFLGLQPIYVVTGYMVVQISGAGVLISRKTRSGERGRLKSG